MKNIKKCLLFVVAAAFLSACGTKTEDNGNVQENPGDGVVQTEIQEIEDAENADEIEEIVYDKTGPFLMTVDSAHSVVGWGTIAVGTIERGQLDLCTELNLVDDDAVVTTTITGMFTGNVSLDAAEEGDHICVKLAHASRTDVYEGETITNDSFSMAVEDVFSIKEAENDYSVYAIGVIESGQMKVGDDAEIVEEGDDYTRKTKIEGIQTYCESITHAEAGEKVVLLLRGVSIDQAHEGQTLEQIE